ncbi:MAG TPA: hypothetical protein VMY76_14715 [Gemmatimonadales bacterium]|nr:hypothetical protein [Gemmatimonadales bacterium]
MSVPIAWVASGGVIRSDGTFSSSMSGTFKVIGRGRGWKQTDTSVVVVVPPTSDLARVEVAPDTVTLEAGSVRSFAASGYLADGSKTTIGVNWTATGGTVDGAGAYTAGAVQGSYRVVASNTSGTLADTAVVTINAPAVPGPPASPPETPVVLAQVVLSPGNASLGTSATKQFKAYGRNSVGDSVPVTVTFSATGGTITSGGLYTAGAAGGTYRVVATAGTLKDTAVVTLTSVAAAGTTATGTGIPFGAFSALTGNTLKSNTGEFNLSHDGYTASNIVARIEYARSRKIKLLLAMTGGSHDKYLTNGVFDRAKWEARLREYDTAEIRQAIAAGVADGTIIGASVMDEPHVSGGDDGAGGGDGNTWGPKGTMTKERVDSLCGSVKAQFPTLPAGVVHQWVVFEPTKNYRVCDFIVSQYSNRMGSVTAYRDSALALGRRSGHAIMFSMNVLNGGVQDRDGTWDCTGTGGLGQNKPNCRMTAQQVRDWGTTLGSAGCGLLMWRYDDAFMANAENKQAFTDLAARMAAAPGRSCRRS